MKPRRIRVLVAHASVVVRRALIRRLESDPEVEVIGGAANVAIALAKIERLAPDAVLLGGDDAETTARATVTEVRRAHARLPIVLVASQGDGAPESWRGDEALHVVREDTDPDASAVAVLDTVKALFSPTRRSAVLRRAAGIAEVGVLALGASTGGPDALAEVFAQLPAALPVPIVLVQHMPPVFTRLLAERLSAVSPIRVREASGGELLSPGEAWIAPGDHHMVVTRDGTAVRLALHKAPPENSCRPAVDVLFRAVAETYGASALAVILTGMGQDGLRGARAVRDAGGTVLAQDEATSVVWGMPGLVAKAGVAAAVLPLRDLGAEIARRLASPRRTATATPPDAEKAQARHGD